MDSYRHLGQAYVRRSTLGYICLYNLLPESVVACPSVASFQRNLQAIVKDRAAAGYEDWIGTLSPRCASHVHPLCYGFS